jgi:hypothetical protein
MKSDSTNGLCCKTCKNLRCIMMECNDIAAWRVCILKVITRYQSEVYSDETAVHLHYMACWQDNGIIDGTVGVRLILIHAGCSIVFYHRCVIKISFKNDMIMWKLLEILRKNKPEPKFRAYSIFVIMGISFYNYLNTVTSILLNAYKI